MTTVVRRPLGTPMLDLVWQPFEDRFFANQLFPELFTYPALRVEEFTEDGTYVVRAELPDIDPDKDLELTIHDGSLHMRATHAEEKGDRQGFRSEFRYGVLERIVPIPFTADQSNVVASYDKGVLEIRIPYSTKTATERIPIRTKPTSKK